MKIEKKLEMNFRDEANGKFKLVVDEPKEDLQGETIKESTDLILEKNIFTPKSRKLVKLEKVNEIRKETKEIVL